MNASGGNRPKWHHLVSRGYQNNFADSQKRLAVLDARSGVLLGERSTKANFAELDFNSVLGSNGEAIATLEFEWAKIERSVLNEIRRIDPLRSGPDQRGAAANLFAIHLVRSIAFREAHRRVIADLRRDEIPSYESDPQIRARFFARFGRPPTAGEITSICNAVLDERISGNDLFIGSMIDKHNKIAEKLSRFFLQVVTLGVPNAGFVLGDTPIVHVRSVTNQYGFRDQLALGDANLIMAPLTRTVLVCFTATRLRHVTITTKRKLHLVNAALWRGALHEVACHPDDVREARRVHARLGELSIGQLIAA